MFKILTSIFLITALGCATNPHSTTNTNISNSKEKDIEILVQTVAHKDLLISSIKTAVTAEIIKNIRKTTNTISNDDIQKIKAFVSNEVDLAYKENQEPLDELLLEINTLYNKYYTHSEVIDLIAFYKTPTGKKTAQKSLQEFKDFFKVAEKFGRFIGHQLQEIFKKQDRYPANVGYINENMPNDAPTDECR